MEDENKEIDYNNVKPKKKKNIFIIILKIIFFPLYLIFLICKGIFKLIFKILMIPIKIVKFVSKELYKFFKKFWKFILRHKKGTIIFVISAIILAIVIYKVSHFFNNYNKIYLMNKEFTKSSEYVYTLDNKVNNIQAKINTLDSINNTKIRIYAGNLNLYENVFENKKSWNININSLIIGMNTIEVTVNLKNNEQISNTFYIYNTNEQNLGNLDINDSDTDGLLNYQEDIIGTNKLNKDTDNDKLTDYYEVYFSLTDPKQIDTDNNNIIDGDGDLDNDGLSNIEEIQYKTNIKIADSDSDGLSDYDEVKKHNTDPNKSDSDSDGINDGLEINGGLNPKEVNPNVSVTKSSEDKNISIRLHNITGEQLSSFKVESSNNFAISKEYEAYIAGPYNISVNGNIESATITFKFDSSILNRGAKPTIFYYNKATKELEELNTTIDGNTASTTITHFSEYILLDKTIIDNKLNNAPKVNGSNVSNTSLSTNEYIVMSFPIFNYFGVPIYIYKIDNTFEGFENVETTFETKLNSSLDIKIDIVCKIISRFAAKILDKMFSWLENVFAKSYESATGDTENYRNFLQYIVLYKHIYGASDLEEYFLETNENIVKDTDIAKKDTDSNNDGISDYFTKLICNGQLTTKYGTNPFGTLSYSEVQKSSDIDKDKLKNGEEIEIIEENGAYYVLEHSSPILADSDNDGVSDKYDASPFEKFDERFSSVDSLNYIPSTPTEDKLEEESKRVYNSTTGDYGSSLTRANMMVSMFGKMPAALALGHFLDNTGTTYSFNNDWGLLETYRGKENLAKNTNSLMNVIENTVKKNQSLYFATNTELTGTNYSEHLEDLADIGWWYAVGYTRSTMTAKATNIDDENYKMTLYYNIVDYYDWNGDADFLSGFGGLVNDAEMYRLHTYGIAQQYRINIPYKMEITWKKGNRYYLNKTYLYVTPGSMSVKQMN